MDQCRTCGADAGYNESCHMSHTGSRHCTEAVEIDGSGPQQTSGGDHLEQSQADQRAELPPLTSLTTTFNPDAAPFVFNPRQQALNPLAAPFNPVSSTAPQAQQNHSASNATRPPFDLSPRPHPLSPNCQPFSPRATVPMADPHSAMYPFDQPILTYSWDGTASSSHAYLESGVVGSGNLPPLCQLTHPTDVDTELNAATRGTHLCHCSVPRVLHCCVGGRSCLTTTNRYSAEHE